MPSLRCPRCHGAEWRGRFEPIEMRRIMWRDLGMRGDGVWACTNCGYVEIL